MKTKGSLLLLAFATLLLAGCGKEITTPSGDTTPTLITSNGLYENKDAWFSVNVPEWWQTEENVYNSIVRFSAPQAEWDALRENVGIMMEQLPYKVTLDEYYEAAKESFQSLITWYVEISKEIITINNLQGIKLIYTWKPAWYDGILQQEYVFLINWTTTYIINYLATPETFSLYSKDVDTLVASFTLQ